MTDPPTIHRATTELLALALAVRTDWTETDIRGAIADATTIGMTWIEILRDTTRLMTDRDAHPRELVPRHRRKQTGVPANAAYREKREQC